MSRSATIRKPERRRAVRIALPRSKSLANRALILASIFQGAIPPEEVDDAEDTRVLGRLLRERPQVMHCGDGGTTFRFLLAWACAQESEERLVTGSPRLLERPHELLVEALRKLGADITRTAEGFRVIGRRMPGGEVTLDSPLSSQYASALLLVAPDFTNGLGLHLTGRILSLPYVSMTVAALREHGISVREEESVIHVLPGIPKPAAMEIPRDWSAAAFWYELVSLGALEEVCLAGLKLGSGQGDEEAVNLWSPWVATGNNADGIILRRKQPKDTSAEALHFDLVNTPDLFQPLAFTCAGLGLTARFEGLDNLRLKETDRLAAVAEAMRMIGCETEHGPDWFALGGGALHVPAAPLNPRGDHRMAMAMAPLAMVFGSMEISDPGVVAKSYPRFWEDLRSAGFGVEFSGD